MILKRDNWFEIRSHWLRSLVDLQYRSLCLSIKKRAWLTRGKRVLDVGSGNSPYRRYFSGAAAYVTCDSEVPADYRCIDDIPEDRRFDLVLLFEVLEHVRDPRELLESVSRRLAPGGEIWVSVPFSARVHRVPRDYWRWTDEGLEALLTESGFPEREIFTRGTEISTIVSKIGFLIFRRVLRPWSAPLALVAAVLLLPWLLPLAHLSLFLRLGSADDPLGFFLTARTSNG